MGGACANWRGKKSKLTKTQPDTRKQQPDSVAPQVESIADAFSAARISLLGIDDSQHFSPENFGFWSPRLTGSCCPVEDRIALLDGARRWIPGSQRFDRAALCELHRELVSTVGEPLSSLQFATNFSKCVAICPTRPAVLIADRGNGDFLELPSSPDGRILPVGAGKIVVAMLAQCGRRDAGHGGYSPSPLPREYLLAPTCSLETLFSSCTVPFSASDWMAYLCKSVSAGNLKPTSLMDDQACLVAVTKHCFFRACPRACARACVVGARAALHR